MSSYYIIYNLLFFITFFVLLVYGQKMSLPKNKNRYWQLAIVPIIAYSLFMGLRFGRLVDYNVYFVRYQRIGEDLTFGNYEFLFALICHVFYKLGVPYQGFILFCSFMYALAFCCMTRRFRQGAMFILPFVLIVGSNEQLIRFMLALSVLIIGLDYLFDKKYLVYALFAVAAFLIHSGTILLAVAWFALSLVKGDKWFNPIVWQGAFVVSVFVINIGMMSVIEPYMSMLAFNSLSERYVHLFSRLITGKFGRMGINETTLFYQLRILLIYSFTIWMIPRMIKEGLVSRFYALCYNIGIVIYPFFNTVEIFNRYSMAFMVLGSVPFGMSLYCAVFQRDFLRKNVFLKALFWLSVVCLFLYVFKTNLSRTEWYKLLFIWDADGRDVLPKALFLQN